MAANEPPPRPEPTPDRDEPDRPGAGEKPPKAAEMLGGLTRRDHPFYEFMVAILDAYHQEGTWDGPGLMARSLELLEKQPRPDVPPGITAEEHAKALVVRAEETPGIDPGVSLQWLIDSLALWPQCAEAYMWVANLIEGRDHAAMLMKPFYVLAIEALRQRLAPQGALDEEDRPRDVPEVAMIVKSLVGLGEAWATSGYSGEGVPLYIEALRYDPADTEGARPRLALALAIRADPEGAAAALSVAEPTPLVLYAKAIASYIRGDSAGPSRQALLEARRANPYVTAIITGRRKMLGMLTGDEQFDQAQYIYLAITPALKVVPGLVAWVKKEVDVASGPSKSQAKKKRR